jgi:hypothetical protein
VRLSGMLLAAMLALAALPASALGNQGGEDGSGGSAFYEIDLSSGEARRIGRIGAGETVVGLAIAPTDGPLNTLFALTADGVLLELVETVPGGIVERTTLRGVGDGESLIGIDVRPATGELYAISDASVVYLIDTLRGEATAVGDPFEPAIEDAAVGFDINPTVDRIRVVVGTGQNLRLNPDTGQIGANPDTGDPTIDADLAYADGDANEGEQPAVVAAAYTNSVADAEETALYVIDAGLGVLALQDPPNDGTLNTVGELGVEVAGPVAFDIAPTGEAFAAIGEAGAAGADGEGDAGSVLYAVDLGTGELSMIGAIGDGESVIGLALPDPATGGGHIFALTTEGELLVVDSADPGTIAERVAIDGLADGESLLAIDVRPATGSLYAVSDFNVLYHLDPATGEATAVGEPFDPALEFPILGFDFNPTVDRIRVVVTTGQNLRFNPETGQIGANPDTGAPTVDANVTYAAGDVNEGAAPQVVAAGYTNSVPDAEATALYVIDAAQGVLALQDPPNDGVLDTVGPLGVDATALTGFDVAASGEAYVVIGAT